MMVLPKVKQRITVFDSAILFPDIHAKELNAGIWKDICTPVSMATVFSIVKK